MLKLTSVVGYLLMIGAVLGLLATHSLLSYHPAVIGAQGMALALMAWARIVFGRRSFHVSTNATQGELVTTGPYALVRNPIYSSVCLFVIAGGMAHPSWPTAGLVVMVILGSLCRIFAEERFLMVCYPDSYPAYTKRTKRLLPFVF